MKKFVPFIEIWHSQEFGKYNVTAVSRGGRTSRVVSLRQTLAVATDKAIAYAKSHPSYMYVVVGPHPTASGRPLKDVKGTYWRAQEHIAPTRTIWKRK